MNDTFFKIRLLHAFLAETQKHRQILLDELVNNATDPTVRKRRFRMLSNLAVFEGSIIKKIQNFETDNIQDFFQEYILSAELDALLDRSA